MSNDKTYLVIIFYESPPRDFGRVVDIFYDDDAVKKYDLNMSLVNPNKIFNYYHKTTNLHQVGRTSRPTTDIYAIELPKSVMTDTGKLEYVVLDATGHMTSLMSQEEVDESIVGDAGSITPKLINNQTNAKLAFIHRYYSIIGLPLPSKMISHQVLSNLI